MQVQEGDEHRRRRVKLLVTGILLVSFTLLYDRRQPGRNGRGVNRLRGEPRQSRPGGAAQAAPAAPVAPAVPVLPQSAAAGAPAPSGAEGLDGLILRSLLAGGANETYPSNVTATFKGTWATSAAPSRNVSHHNDSLEVVLAHAVQPVKSTFPLDSDNGKFSLRLRDSPMEMRGLSGSGGITMVEGRLLLRESGRRRDTMIADVKGLYIVDTGRLTLFANTAGDVSMLLRVKSDAVSGQPTESGGESAVPGQSGGESGVSGLSASPLTDKTSRTVKAVPVTEGRQGGNGSLVSVPWNTTLPVVRRLAAAIFDAGSEAWVGDDVDETAAPVASTKGRRTAAISPCFLRYGLKTFSQRVPSAHTSMRSSQGHSLAPPTSLSLRMHPPSSLHTLTHSIPLLALLLRTHSRLNQTGL